MTTGRRHTQRTCRPRRRGASGPSLLTGSYPPLSSCLSARGRVVERVRTPYHPYSESRSPRRSLGRSECPFPGRSGREKNGTSPSYTSEIEVVTHWIQLEESKGLGTRLRLFRHTLPTRHPRHLVHSTVGPHHNVGSGGRPKTYHVLTPP